MHKLLLDCTWIFHLTVYLFHTLFKNSDAYIEIIILLSKTKLGLSRSDIDVETKLSSNGGRLTERLRDLCSAGFIEERVSWNKKKGEYYKLIDEFSLFYLYWIKMYENKKFMRNHWLNQSDTLIKYYKWLNKISPVELRLIAMVVL